MLRKEVKAKCRKILNIDRKMIEMALLIIILFTCLIIFLFSKGAKKAPLKIKKHDIVDIQLLPLKSFDREKFIKDNQEAFNYGALQEFGVRDEHFEEDGQIISRDTIEHAIDEGEAYRIVLDGKSVGGAVIHTNGEHGELDLLFVSPQIHSKGIGYAAWCGIEKLHPEVKVWGDSHTIF